MSSRLGVEHLASYRRCVERIRSSWPAFLEARALRLEEGRRHPAAEKVAENIVEDLFTKVLDWSLADLNHQVQGADILLTKHGIKYLLIETKRPGGLAWHRRAVEKALEQARQYAAEQRVRCIAVSDGFMLYAADLVAGGLRDRAFVALAQPEPPLDLWWLSVHGIYRERPDTQGAELHLLPPSPVEREERDEGMEEAALLHPKYGLPARCFAYVGHAARPATWKLPYRLADGSVDEKRLPKAIQAILSNYRGAKVSGIPEADTPMVLLRLARAAASPGRMPFQTASPATVYRQLQDALEQLGILDQVVG